MMRPGQQGEETEVGKRQQVTAGRNQPPSVCKWVEVLRASLVAQLVKNPSAMQETLVRFGSWEVPLEKG